MSVPVLDRENWGDRLYYNLLVFNDTQHLYRTKQFARGVLELVLEISYSPHISNLPLKRGLIIKSIPNVSGYELVELFLCGHLRQRALEVKLDLRSLSLRVDTGIKMSLTFCKSR